MVSGIKWGFETEEHTDMMEKNAKIYVAGHKGMVGSAIVRELKKQGYENLVFRTHKELDLTRQADVEAFFAEEKPEYVFHPAGKVGGIVANQNALADFLYENMMMEMNVIHAAVENGVKFKAIRIESGKDARNAPTPVTTYALFFNGEYVTNEQMNDKRFLKLISNNK